MTRYSRPLQEEAWHVDGSEASACSYLASDRIQEELSQIFATANATSLDVERKHAVDKKNERSKIITVARASRNQILRQYRIMRERTQQKARAVRKKAMGQWEISIRVGIIVFPEQRESCPPPLPHT